MSVPLSSGFRAGGTINVGRCVKISADNTVVQCTAATDGAIGIAKRSMRDTPGLTGSDNTIAALAGEGCEVFTTGAIAPAITGAAVTAGNWVTSDATGKVIPAAGATTRPVGYAREGAAAANIEIQITVQPYSATLQ